MVSSTVDCPHCQSDVFVRNGRAPNGTQKYFCRVYQRPSRENPSSHASSTECREETLRAYEERSGLRRLGRTFGISHHSVMASFTR